MEAIIKIGLLIILSVYLPEIQPYKITHINAVVNTPVNLTCELECPGEAKWISLYLLKTTDVASCDKEKCWIMDSFQKRFTFPGDRTTGTISLLIPAVVYNDKGSYRCSCDGKEAGVKLNVFVPTVLTAHKLESVSLPCYGDTRRGAKNVQWKKGKQLVLEYRESGTMTRGSGFEDRFWVSSEAYKVGELSLHIDSVRQSDAGLYVCTIRDESIDGEPRAVLLKVEERSPSLEAGMVVAVVFLILFALIIVLLAAVIILLRRKRIISWQDIKGLVCRGASTARPPVQEQNPLSDMRKSSTTPILPPPPIYENEDE